MTTTRGETLAAAARSEGIDCDGLRVETDDDRFSVTIEEAGVDESGLTEADLDRLADDYPEYVSNWAYWTQDRSDADRAFLRWAERAGELSVPERYDRLRDGMTRTWGEMRVESRLADGDRVYELRHEEDAGRARS